MWFGFTFLSRHQTFSPHWLHFILLQPILRSLYFWSRLLGAWFEYLAFKTNSRGFVKSHSWAAHLHSSLNFEHSAFVHESFLFLPLILWAILLLFIFVLDWFSLLVSPLDPLFFSFSRWFPRGYVLVLAAYRPRLLILYHVLISSPDPVMWLLCISFEGFWSGTHSLDLRTHFRW